MGLMRALQAAGLAALCALVLAATGCGGSSEFLGGSPGAEAARLVPPTALALVSVDTDLQSAEWQRLDDLTRGLPARQQIEKALHDALAQKQLNFDRDVRPALGRELNLVVLGGDAASPDVVALAQPEDQAKLLALASRFDEGNEHYTVEQIGGWSVVADSADAFDAVRSASTGRSLADVAGFKAASARLGTDALARLYVDGPAAAKLSAHLGALGRLAGNPAWAAASLATQDDAVRIRLASARTGATPTAYAPKLLKEVPSGASLAVSFRGAGNLLTQLAAQPQFAPLAQQLREYLGVGPAGLAPLLRGEGVLYVGPAGLIPSVALELESSQPAKAAATLRRVAQRLSAKGGGLLMLTVSTRPGRVVLASSPQAAAALAGSGSKLVSDRGFKDALAAADAPAKVTGLAYANVQELLPLVQAAAAALGKPLSQETAASLGRIRTAVAFGTAGPSAAGSDLWLQLGGG
jgi:Protein of unknown function (DUF3352)